LAACSARQPADFAHSTGEDGGFVWRTINLSESESVLAWIEEEIDRQQQQRQLDVNEEARLAEIAQRAGYLGYWDNGIFTRGVYPRLREIVHINPATRQETVLLYGGCSRGIHSREQYLACDEFCAEGPRFIRWLCDRYFIFNRFWGGSEGLTPIGYGVFDLQMQQAHFVELDNAWIHPTVQRNYTLFWENGAFDSRGEFSIHSGTLNLFATDLTVLPNLEFIDLLAGSTHQPAQYILRTLLCDNERFYIVVCSDMLSIFDLHEHHAVQLRKDLFRIPTPDCAYLASQVLSQVYLRNNTLYWLSAYHNTSTPYLNIAVEITLPT